MGVTAFHSRTATGADDPSYDVQLQRDWNAAHLLTLNAVGSEVSNAFGNAGGVTFGYDGTNVTAAAPAGAPSPVNFSAGTTSNNLASVVFSDSNGVGWGLNGSTITASYTQSTHAHTAWPLGFSAGTQTATSGTPGLANSNNFTFGMSGSSQITASFSESTHAHTAWPQAIQAGTQTATSGTIIFSNSNGISFGMSGTATVTASYTVPTVTNSSWTVSDAATSGTVGRLAFTNLNGVTLSLSTGGGGSHTIVGSHNALTSQSNQAASAANGSFAFQTVSFSNVNGVSFGTSAGSAITASIATSLTNINVSAGTTSNNLSAITFSNSNGVSFGLSGSVITATVNPGAAAGIAALENSQTTYTSGTVILTEGGGAITIGSDTGQHFSFSVPQTSSIVGTSGLSISSAGSTISVYPKPLSVWEPVPIITGTGTSSHAPASIWFSKFVLDWDVAVSNVQMVKSINASVPGATSVASAGTEKFSYTHGLTFFTRQDFAGNSTNLSQWTTASFGMTASLSYTSTAQSAALSWVTNSTGGTTSFSTTSSSGNWSRFFTGLKLFQIPLVTTLTPGEYFVGQQHSSTASTNNSAVTLLSVSNFHIVEQSNSIGTVTSSGSIVSSAFQGIGIGVASAVTTNNTMAASVISAGTQNWWYLHFIDA